MMHAAIAPQDREIALLAQCLTVEANPVAIERPCNGIDWGEFLRLSREHGVSPLVFHSLSQCSLGPESAETLHALQADFQHNALNASRLSMELAAALRLLDERGIEAVAFKGAALATSTYGEVWLRQFSDNDVLVRTQDAVAAYAVLAERGYRGSPELDAAQQRLLVRGSPFAYAFSLSRGGGPVAIDLHWRLSEAGHPAYPARLHEPWERLIETDTLGGKTRIFGPEDTLLLVSAHAAKHCWARLRWICDIAQAVRSAPELDWDDALGAAAETGPIGRRTLLTSLGVADALFDLPLPADVRRAMQTDAATAGIVSEILGGLRSPEKEWPMWWPRSFEGDAYFLRIAASPWSGAAYFCKFCAWRVAAPDAKDRAWIPLPRGLSFLYYALRPLRLLREYGWGPIWEFLKLAPKALRQSGSRQIR
jgi:hypothetical protein